LLVYLGCPFLIAPSVFTNVYYIYTPISIIFQLHRGG